MIVRRPNYLCVPLLLPMMEFCYRIFARYRLPLTGKKQSKNSYHESNKPQ